MIKPQLYLSNNDNKRPHVVHYMKFIKTEKKNITKDTGSSTSKKGGKENKTMNSFEKSHND